jgi:type IV pilus assembly protein PilM
MVFQRKNELIGIDIGSSAVKMVQLREARSGYQLVSLGMAPLPPEAIVDNAIMDANAVAAAIRELVERHKVKTKNVATSVSGHAVIIRKILLPLMTAEEMEASLEWEAEQYIPFEIADVNLDAQILGPDAKDPSQMNVILVAAKKDVVDDYVALFRQCGLTPLIMDVDCFAVSNVYEAEYGTAEQEVVALIDLGASSLNVNILKGGVPVFTRDIQIGGNLYKEELQKRLGLSSQDAETVMLGGEVSSVSPAAVTAVIEDATEALTTDIQRSLDFFSASSSDERPRKVFITGGVSRMPAIRTSLTNRLGIDVQVIDPWRQVAFDQKAFDADYLQAMGPLYTVAVGLAMRRVGDK